MYADTYSSDRTVLARIFTSCPEVTYKSTEADTRNGIEFRGTTRCDPTGSCCMELKQSSEERMVKVIFVSIDTKFIEVTTEKFVLRVS